MSNLSGITDSANGAVATGGSTLPAGEYVACLVKSEMRASKNKPQNAYLNCEFEVYEGPSKGRRFFHMFNLVNDNPEAKEISDRNFNSLCEAAGKLRSSVTSSEQLHGIPVRCKLTVKTDSYGDKNAIAGGVFKPMNAAPGAGAQQHAQGGAAGGGAAPWRASA